MLLQKASRHNIAHKGLTLSLSFYFFSCVSP